MAASNSRSFLALLKSLFSIGLGSLVGCAQQPQAGRVPRPVAKGEAGDWLIVSSDPAAIAEVRKRAATGVERSYEECLNEAVSGGGYVEPTTFAVLESRRAETISRLETLIAKGPADEEAIGAALLLLRFEHSGSRDLLASALQTGSLEQRRQILIGIVYARDFEEATKVRHRQFIAAAPALVTALFDQMNSTDPGVVKAAVQTCGSLDLPGVYEQLKALCSKPDVPDRGRILYWLSNGPLTPDLLDEAIKAIGGPSEAVGEDALLEAFARQQDDPALRRRARDGLKQRLEVWPDDGTRGYQGGRLEICQVLGETSDASDVEWLKTVVTRERGYYLHPLLLALVKLEGGDRGRDRVIALLSDPQNWSDGIVVAGEVYAATADQAIVKALSTLADAKQDRELVQVCEALVSIGGDQARQQVEKVLPRFAEPTRLQFQSKLSGPPLAELVKRAVDLGIIDGDTTQRALTKVSADQQPNFITVLTECGALLAFDAETGQLPCRHDQLLEEFAAHSRGQFRPEAATEEWLRQHDEVYEAEYVLRFVSQDRAYQVTLRNFGDWYDVERIVLAVNRALSDAGNSARFNLISADDQVATLIFADPAKLKPLAASAGLHLSTDLNNARESGVEFERRVLETQQE